MAVRVLETAIALKAFAAPSAAAHVDARLPRGRYCAVDERVIGDDAWVAVPSPVSAGIAWLCARSGHREYAHVVERAAPHHRPRSLDGDPHAVRERELLTSLAAFAGWRYSHDDPRYPSDIGSVALPHAPPNANNCCTFVEALVAGTFARVHATPWSQAQHDQMMVEADDHFSPITALVDGGHALPVTGDDLAPPPPWTVFQGWRAEWSGGHTFIAVDHHAESDKVLVLESNSTAELDGVGWRGIGRAAAPPAQWWTVSTTWSWARIASTYPLRHRCRLRVSHRAIAGLG